MSNANVQQAELLSFYSKLYCHVVTILPFTTSVVFIFCSLNIIHSDIKPENILFADGKYIFR